MRSRSTEPRPSGWNRHLACGHTRDSCVTSVHRPAEAGLVRAALKRTHSRGSGATRESGVRNFSSALTSVLEHRGLRQLSNRTEQVSKRVKKGAEGRRSCHGLEA
jgi:hypothetical protein